MTLILCLLGAAALAQARTAPQVFGARTLVDHGDPSNRYDIVFVGDGYRAQDQAEFVADVDQAVRHLRGRAPFDTYWPYINVHRIDVGSVDRGYSQERGVTKDTAFGVSYGRPGRYVGGDRSSINQLVARHAPDADAIVCLVADGYGGASYGTICFVGNLDPTTTTHELGHSIGRLSDEYDSGSAANVQVPSALLGVGELVGRPLALALGWRFDNVTTHTTRSEIPWSYWIRPSTPVPTPDGSPEVGLFEGALHLRHGIYRPEHDCVMRRSETFCVVCRERLVLELSDKVAPYAFRSQRIPGGWRLGFTSEVPGRVRARWFLGEREVATDAQWVRFTAAETFRVRLEVADATPWVRSDRERVLLHLYDWRVNAQGARVQHLGTRTGLGLALANPRGNWTRATILEPHTGLTAAVGQ
ncbi:MAG: M64 family metallopeptidase [Planctomycetota bacterium]